MKKNWFVYISGIFCLVMQLGFSLTFNEIEKKMKITYEKIYKYLPPKDQDIFKRNQMVWQQYRDLRCKVHEEVYKGDHLQCRIHLTFDHHLYLQLLKPNNDSLIEYMNTHIQYNVKIFQNSQIQYLNNPFEQNIADHLDKLMINLFAITNAEDHLNIQKTHLIWKNYRDTFCSVLDDYEAIPKNYCIAQISLDIIDDLSHYIQR